MGTWPVHLFVSRLNTAVLHGLDAYAFSSYINKQLSSSRQEWVVGAELGIWVYGGKATWRPQTLEIGYQQGISSAVPTAYVDPTYPYEALLSQAANISKIIYGTPNVMLIIKSLKPVLLTLDDYSYYLFLSGKNPSVQIIYEMCWNATSTRWLPEYIHFIPNYGAIGLQGLSDRNRTSMLLQNRSQTILFLPSTHYYWISYIPINLLVGIALFFFYKRVVVRYLKFLINPLIANSSLSTLIWSICCQCTQHLSFRCFNQLTTPVATSFIQYLNLVVCLLVLFAITLFAVSLPFLMKYNGDSYCILEGILRPN